MARHIVKLGSSIISVLVGRKCTGVLAQASFEQPILQDNNPLVIVLMDGMALDV